MDKISDASGNQVWSISSLKTEVEDINNIIQSNVTVSEESASASQELYVHSEHMKNMVSKFKIK